MATLTGQKINTTYDGLLKTEDNQPISTTKKRVTDGYGNQTGLSVDSLGNVDVSDDLNVLGNAVVTGSTTANSFIKTGGTSAQFLKADGSIDGNTYLTSSTDTLDSVTDRGNSTTNSITVNGLTATTATVDSLEIQFGLRDQANSLGTNGQMLTSTGTGTDWKSTSELGLIDGSGTTNRLPKFTDADTIGNSTITDTGTKIGVNNANPTYSLDVYRNEATNILRLQNNTFSSWFGSDATGFSIETNLFKPIVFKPSGVETMTLNSSGNVGIGTSSPAQKLSIDNGYILIKDNAYDTYFLSKTRSDGSQLVGFQSHGVGALSIHSNSAERMRIDSAGNVGIGTSSPTRQLTVNGTTSSVININSNTTNGLSILAFGDSDDDNYAQIVLDNENNKLQIQNGGGAGISNRGITLDSNENVGIGTSSPSAKLHISSGSFNQLLLQRTGGANAGVNFKMINSDGEIAEINNTSENAIQFQTGGAERMRIDSAGNVGIGTSSPARELDVVGVIQAQGNFKSLVSSSSTNLATSNGGNVTLVNSSATNGNFNNIGGYNSNGLVTSQINFINVNHASRTGDISFHTHNGSNLTERMRITSGGFLKASNTGVYRIATGNFHELITNQNEVSLFIENSNASPYGTRIEFPTDPNNTVNYFLRATGNGLSRILIYSNGNVINTNNSYGAISDIKLKENITDAAPKLDDLMKVKVRNYNLIGEETKQLGVVAQELEEVFPSMISESPDTEEQEVTDAEGNVTKERVDLGTTTKSVKYSVFVPMLIKAMQEQQEIINDLKARIEILETK